ncbi:hypothetical protein Z948_780 [Sulfitobacter donghicola DSW-25 = KCTC 12864 = JCM 14565]|nr:hypothetical protein Z948_780 [Sulfitobacter donghicola DSW-25 = KCTC 12864 = JCM 14565]
MRKHGRGSILAGLLLPSASTFDPYLKRDLTASWPQFFGAENETFKRSLRGDYLALFH